MKLPIYIAENTYGNYLRINSSETGSGLFLCTITRDILDPKDFLKKQALKGLIIPRKSAPKQLITPQESGWTINLRFHTKLKKIQIIEFVTGLVNTLCSEKCVV